MALLLAAAPTVGDTLFATGGPIGQLEVPTYRLVADDFSLAETSSLTGATIAVTGRFDFTDWDGTAEYYLFADANGLPGQALAQGQGRNIALTGAGYWWDNLPIEQGGHGESRWLAFDFEVPINVEAGSLYWLGMHLQAGYSDGRPLSAFWHFASSTGNAAIAPYGDLEDWRYSAQVGTLAFSLQGTAVPGPATIVLLGTGVLCLVARRSRSGACIPRF